MDNVIGITGQALALISLAYLLTRSLLRSTTLSSASGKEGLRNFFCPLSREAKERVEQRSAFGVSRFYAMQFAEVILKVSLIPVLTVEQFLRTL